MQSLASSKRQSRVHRLLDNVSTLFSLNSHLFLITAEALLHKRRIRPLCTAIRVVAALQSICDIDYALSLIRLRVPRAFRISASSADHMEVTREVAAVRPPIQEQY